MVAKIGLHDGLLQASFRACACLKHRYRFAINTKEPFYGKHESDRKLLRHASIHKLNIKNDVDAMVNDDMDRE